MVTEVERGTFYAHESAIVDAGALIGADTRIWHWTHICSGAVIGSGCSLGQNVYIGKARIGNGVKVQNNVSIYDGVDIEDDVFCGPSMVFTNVINPRSFIERKHEYRSTLVRRGTTIGANAVVICGHTIGTFAMIGAGAVVTKDVHDFALMVGNPARQIGWVCRCGVSLKPDGEIASCRACALGYRIRGGDCAPLEDVLTHADPQVQLRT